MPEIPEASYRLAIYARVSTEEQREGQNIDSQVAELERFSRDKGWPIVGTYKDEGWSGGVMERPELDRLRDDAQKGVFEAVLINDVDRLARDVAHLGVIKRDLERKGVKVVFRKLPSDASPTNNLMVNILGSFAEFERELIADRTRRGRRHKVEFRKQYLGSNTAYGFRYTPLDHLSGREGILAIEPAEAKVVQRMFEWVDHEGLSARRVLNRLNELQIPPRKRAGKWAKSSVLRILHSEMYAGVWHYNKFQACEPRNASTTARYRKHAKSSIRQRPKSEWLPLALPESLRIVTHDQWDRVQHQLQQNIAFSPRNEKHQYLLKGLVQCGSCGGSYTGDTCHGRYYYRCVRRCKRKPSISELSLDDTVKEAVRDALVNPDTIVEPLRKLNDTEARAAGQRERMAKVVERESNRLLIEEQRLIDAYRTGVLSPEQLAGQLEKVKAQRASVDLERSRSEPLSLISSEQVERSVTEYCEEATANLDNFTEDEWQDLLRAIVEVVVFNGTGIEIQGRIPIAGVTNSGAPLQIAASIPSRSSH